MRGFHASVSGCVPRGWRQARGPAGVALPAVPRRNCPQRLGPKGRQRALEPPRGQPAPRREMLPQPFSWPHLYGLAGDALPQHPRGHSHQTGHREQRDTRATSSHFPVPGFFLPLCLAKYRPKMMSRQSIANTTTATTPPTTAWSTLRIAPSSPARESVEIRRGMRIRDSPRCALKGRAVAALGMGKATLVPSKGKGVKHGAI